MMRTYFLILIAVVLPISAVSRCQYGCTCYDDSICEYYCNNNKCQSAIPLWSKCSGYYVHPRECGIVSYCDPDSGFTCQLQKNYGEQCMYSYSCLSGNCDYRTKTCQSKYTYVDWLLPILLPSVLVCSMLIIIFVMIVACRRRQQSVTYCQSPYIILPPDTSYSYQNSCMITETSPPPYPGVNS